MAGQVDALYIYLLLVAGVMTALIFLAVTVLAIKYRRVSRPRSPTDRRLHDPRNHLVDHPVLCDADFLHLGRRHLLQGAHASRRLHRSLRRRQAVDVEDRAHGGAARDQRTARPHRPEHQAHHDLAGRDSQLLRSRIPPQAGRACPAATPRSGSKPPKPGHYHLFCAEYCGTMHSGMGGDIVVMEPQDYAQWMAGAAVRALAGNRQGIVLCARMRHLPSFRRAGPRPQSGRRLQQTGSARRRTHRDCRRELCSRVHPQSHRKDRKRFQAGDADLPGHRQRRAVERAGGLRQIVSPATPGNRRARKTSPPLSRHNHRRCRCNSHGEHSNSGESGSKLRS